MKATNNKAQTVLIAFAVLLMVLVLLFCAYLLWIYPEDWSFISMGIGTICAPVLWLIVEKDVSRLKKSISIIVGALSIILLCRDKVKMFFSPEELSSVHQFRIYLSGYKQHEGEHMFPHLAGDFVLPLTPPAKYYLTAYSTKTGSLYPTVYDVLTRANKEESVKLQKSDELALDCVEIEIFNGLSEKSINGWASTSVPIMVKSQFNSGGTTYPGTMREKDGIVLSRADVARQFKDNPLFKYWAPGILLPPNTKFSVSRKDGTAEWNLSNEYVGVSLKLFPSLGVPVTGSVWGLTDGRQGQNVSAWVVVGNLHVKFKNKMLGDKKMSYYRAWVDNLMIVLNSFDWKTIEDELQKDAIQQTAIAVVK